MFWRKKIYLIQIYRGKKSSWHLWVFVKFYLCICAIAVFQGESKAMPQVGSTVINGGHIPDATTSSAVWVLPILLKMICICACVLVLYMHLYMHLQLYLYFTEVINGVALLSASVLVLGFFKIVSFCICICEYICFCICIIICICLDVKTKVHRPRFLLTGQLLVLPHSFSVRQTNPTLQSVLHTLT